MKSGKINVIDINYMFRINGFTAADADKLPLISSARFSEANKAFALPLTAFERQRRNN